ncbi:MAG: hypothetical protein N2689_01330 [Verrucomicrobiae bacterium]|nr:hypothetical protein [Verrucomicrobiae bacterium]
MSQCAKSVVMPVWVTLLLFYPNLWAQQLTELNMTPKPGDQPVVGRFYVSVDDAATIFVNGRQVAHAGINESSSPETTLRIGDVIAIHLVNKGGPKRFKMVFVSNDNRTVISFRHGEYREVGLQPHGSVTKEMVLNCSKRVNPQRGRQPKLHPGQLPDTSSWVWGSSAKCMIATVVSSEMIRTAGH